MLRLFADFIAEKIIKKAATLNRSNLVWIDALTRGRASRVKEGERKPCKHCSTIVATDPLIFVAMPLALAAVALIAATCLELVINLKTCHPERHRATLGAR